MYNISVLRSSPFVVILFESNIRSNVQEMNPLTKILFEFQGIGNLIFRMLKGLRKQP